MTSPSLHLPNPPVQVVTVVEKILATACPAQEVEIPELVPSLLSSSVGPTGRTRCFGREGFQKTGSV